MMDLCPHSVFLHPVVLYAESIPGYRKNVSFGGEYFQQQFSVVLMGINSYPLLGNYLLNIFLYAEMAVYLRLAIPKNICHNKRPM
ncbi:MAG: hypothetical protein D3904_02450 [Candidatus Electrothrix sp. EH2]|nr:hypothetical protein [Candidatus Electrothrix sp. EH2]